MQRPWLTSRRRFLGSAAAAVAAGTAATALTLTGRRAPASPGDMCAFAPPPFQLPLDAVSPNIDAMRSRFNAWFEAHALATDPKVERLIYNFYDPGQKRGEWLYPMLSAKAILWLLTQDRVAEAERIAWGVMRHQQVRRDGAWARSYGAFPSIISYDAKKKRWIVGDRFYAGDGLCMLEALVVLFERTRKPEYRNSAIGLGTWLSRVMCAGKDYGVWHEDHAAPMQFVTSAGVFNNAIYTNVEMLWISALKRLGQATNQPTYCDQADRAYAFYLTGHRSGPFMDHYEPGWPPEPFDPTRWRYHAPANPPQPAQLISDNVMRAALGACRMGDLGIARATFDWLHLEDGGVPAYLDARTGTPGFLPQDHVYYDVVSSGMHRSLCQWLNEPQAGLVAHAFLAAVQDDDGGFHWGALRGTRKPLTAQQSPMVGFWATANLAETLT